MRSLFIVSGKATYSNSSQIFLAVLYKGPVFLEDRSILVSNNLVTKKVNKFTKLCRQIIKTMVKYYLR